jgi:hypothetical protein
MRGLYSLVGLLGFLLLLSRPAFAETLCPIEQILSCDAGELTDCDNDGETLKTPQPACQCPKGYKLTMALCYGSQTENCGGYKCVGKKVVKCPEGLFYDDYREICREGWGKKQ